MKRATWNLKLASAERFDPPAGDWCLIPADYGSCFVTPRAIAFDLPRILSDALPYKQATVAPNFKTGRIELSREYFAVDEPVNPLEYPLDELLWIHRLAMGARRGSPRLRSDRAGRARHVAYGPFGSGEKHIGAVVVKASQHRAC